MDRIASYSNTNYLINNANRLQAELATKQIQSSSGLKSNSYNDISSNSKRLVNLENEYSSLVKISESNKMIGNRIENYYDSVSSITSLVTALRTKLSSAISGSGSASVTSSEASNSLSELVSILNTKYEGKYVFSGTDSDVKPINIGDSDYTSLDFTTANTGYYQGNSSILSATISKDNILDYGITADNSAFEKAFRAIKLIQENPSDSQTLSDAYELLTESISELGEIQESLSNKANALDKQNDTLLASVDLLDDMISDIKNVDVAQVAVELSQYETQIEAAYSVITKVMKLNLSDYL